MNENVGGHAVGFAGTKRTDTWWVEPLWTGLGFLCFVVYANWAMFCANHYYFGSYLSPFYSPLLFVKENVPGGAPLHHAWFGAWPSWWPQWLPPSPAMLILIGPLSFRLTCYYYRKFYYRSYFSTPPACAVNPFPQSKYNGETKLFIFQNLHRYTFYIAVFYIVVLAIDAFNGFFRDGEFGIGVGTVVLVLNVVFLSCYTFGCHAWRHLSGGRMNCFTCPQTGHEQTGYKIWKRVTQLNEHHMFWAWVSMIWVGFSDFYIRMASLGYFHDFSTWNK